MSDWSDIFDGRVSFDAAMDAEAFLSQLPARWAVYLLAGEEDRPLQLLSVRNLRASVRRRLYRADEAAGGRRVDYRALVRSVFYRRVDSAFAADLVYLHAAREIFPSTYRALPGFGPAWFVHVNAQARAPRYLAVRRIASRGATFGPLPDKHAAQRLVEEIEDAFDLCRYHKLLSASPNATACAYKDMGRCPAPCDGTVELGEYRRQVEMSVSALRALPEHLRAHEARMQAAAAEQEYESAGRIRQYVLQLQKLRQAANRHAAGVEEMQYVFVQPGPRAGTATVFVTVRGHCREVCGVIAPPTAGGELLREVLLAAEQLAELRDDEASLERTGVIARHLFAGVRRGQCGVLKLALLEADTLDREIGRVLRWARGEEAPESEAEGLESELEAL